jgi:hypothetical protein
MKTRTSTKMNARPAISLWIRSASLLLLATGAALVLSAGCSQADGSACNPALSHDECDNAPSVQCVQPSAPNCYGQAYCCTVDSNGNITDTSDNCQYLIHCQDPPAEGGTPEMDSAVSDATGTDGG